MAKWGMIEKSYEVKAKIYNSKRSDSLLGHIQNSVEPITCVFVACCAPPFVLSTFISRFVTVLCFGKSTNMTVVMELCKNTINDIGSQQNPSLLDYGKCDNGM